jgi:sterol 3beta-glucosyltransferase
MSALSITKVPFLYNFSSAVVPKPLDWHDDITITGYWNLENSDLEWSPPKELEEFMAKAKADGKALVYIVSIAWWCFADTCRALAPSWSPTPMP